MNFPQMILLAAKSSFASAATTHGFLPPSSRETGIRFSYAFCITYLPTLQLPVKKI